MFWGRDSTLGIATGYGLDGRWFEARRGRRFSPQIRPHRP